MRVVRQKGAANPGLSRLYSFSTTKANLFFSPLHGKIAWCAEWWKSGTTRSEQFYVLWRRLFKREHDSWRVKWSELFLLYSRVIFVTPLYYENSCYRRFCIPHESSLIPNHIYIYIHIYFIYGEFQAKSTRLKPSLVFFSCYGWP